jgi:hypothetical protein
MSSITFENFLDELVNAIDESNTHIIDQITEPNMKYEWSCIKPTLTYKNYFSILKKAWDKAVNKLANQTDMCDTFSKFMVLFKVVGANRDLININSLKELDPDNIKKILADTFNKADPKNQELQNMVLDAVADIVIKGAEDYTMDTDVAVTISRLVKLLGSRSMCWLWDIIMTIITKKYKVIIKNKSKQDVSKLLRDDITYVINRMRATTLESTNQTYAQLVDDIANKMMLMQGTNIDAQLNKMIPDSMGSLKKFFVKTISTYYNKLHPIVWAQIVRGIIVNFIVELPASEDELFKFLSKQLLLNSGPFILKILQQVKPAMSDELKEKYNLKKLTYPLMNKQQYEIILKKIVKDFDMYQILGDNSASVGHVFFVKRADSAFRFVIKLAKPLAVAQSCWEYYLLNGLFKEGTCEQEFVNSMLSATGKELYAPNEIANIKLAKKSYSMAYSDLFKASGIDVKLTTVDTVEGVIKEGVWFALTMTLAEGQSVASLLEPNSQLYTDTIFRATLHRCMDLLVYKFFINLIQRGYSHGDAHLGNMYFSYVKRQLTLIDWGATLKLDIFKNDPTIRQLLDIILMSIYYNYPDLLDAMTLLMNSACKESEGINTSNEKYLKFRNQLKKIQYQNMLNEDASMRDQEAFEKSMMAEERLRIEASKMREVEASPENKIERYGEPYEYLNIKTPPKEQIVENRDHITYGLETRESKVTTFGTILNMIVTFYSESGVNIAIRFSDFYELLKAYLLLSGSLSQVGYQNERMSFIMSKLLYDTSNLKLITKPRAIFYLFKSYRKQEGKYKKLKEKINNMVRKQNKQ